MKRSLTLLTVPVLLAVPATAGAQTPVPTPAPPAPAAAAGKVSIKVTGGQATKKARYVARGGSLRVKGLVKPAVPGQIVMVEVTRKKKAVARRPVPVDASGRISVKMKAPKTGLLGVRIRHAATPQQVAFRSKKVTVHSLVANAGQGARGVKVLLLQRGLARMGYVVPQNGVYEGGTSRAVLAFHKVNGQRRSGFADRRVFSMVLRNKGGFKLRYPKAGRHVEFDWSRQVLVLADKGRARRIYHASSGAPATPTVFGTFRFYRRDLGTNAKGMVDAAYFIGGYAIHGYSSVPAGPASHGCIRVPIPNARSIRDAVSLGEQIMVYR